MTHLLPRIAPPIERIRRRLVVNEATGCHEFTGYRNRGDYGVIGIDGQARLVHRVMWELTHGPIPDGLNVLHRCDNRPCCFGGHLYLGTQQQNVRDMFERGRGEWARGDQHWLRRTPGLRRGERHPMSKLRREDATAIRERYALGGVSQREIAEAYNVSTATVSRVVCGASWNEE